MIALLILGLFLWIAAHLLKRLAPDMRASLGEQKGRGVIAAAIFLSLVLMVIGFRGAAVIDIWTPPAFLRHVNNLMMLLAVFMYGVGSARGQLAQVIRHPQLIAVKTWALAHLIVNGDLASIILFGGMLGWAVVEVILINKAQPEWTRPEQIRPRGDLVNVGIALVIFIIMALIHTWLGYSPFG